MNLKIKCLREKLKLSDIQGMIVSNPVNIKYLTNIEAEGILLITRKENIYITDGRYIESVNSILTINDEVIVYNIKDVSKYDCENFFMFCENIGFEENHITYSKYKEYIHKYKINNFTETDGIIESQRAIKDEEEISILKQSCKILDDCFSYLLKYIKKGMNEKEIANEIEKYFKSKGAEGVSFDSIIASGPNSSMPHAVPTDRQISSGDTILIDMGCKYKGYCSDMSRTIFVDYVPEEIKPIYDIVLKNQEQILKEIKDGANARILTMMVEGDFKINGYTFVHSLGHGVGLEIHEDPRIGNKDYLLKENMTITNEPGIYIPGKFGVRIEDTVLVTKSGCIKLTNSEKNYTIIKTN